MDRSVKELTLSVKNIFRNARISHIRSAVEYSDAFFKWMFHLGIGKATSAQRVTVKTFFTTLCINIVMARFLDWIG